MTREEAIDILQGAIKKPNTKDGYLGQAIDMAIESLKQEPKTGQGKWIEERTYMECSHCHDIWHYEENQTERFKYCPTCGERNEYESKYTRNGI